MADNNGPVLIELDGDPAPTPSEAPPVPDDSPAPVPSGRAMRQVVRLAGHRPSRLTRWFWQLLGALAGFGLSLWAWNAINALLARNPVLGYVALGLTVAFLVVCLGIILREWAGIARLRRVDGLRKAAEQALSQGDLAQARQVATRLESLYRPRAELEWGRARFAERREEQFDADGLLGLAEAELLAPLDAAARAEIEAAARQVATITAIVPLALADVVTALTANLRMIRRIAEVYGGRAGTLGNWRLARSVMSHLVATGAVAVGDDLIGSVAGGGVLSKISRRFGEGMINGALTARVGLAAIEVCRPLPFRQQARPSVSAIVKRALAGLFASK